MGVCTETAEGCDIRESLWWAFVRKLLKAAKFVSHYGGRSDGKGKQTAPRSSQKLYPA